MIKIQIDHKIIDVEEGTKLIEAARQNGISIPSLCYRDDLPHYTSCSVCLVKNTTSNKFLHSCSVNVQEGMLIDASSEEVKAIRKDALSMLLAEHRAECEAPCKLVCPMDLNIPVMNRLLQHGEVQKAAELALKEMGMPETLCSICPAYCENACRRKMVDTSIAIRAVKAYTADHQIYSPSFSANKRSNAQKIAIVGGGISSLLSAYFLVQKGHECVLFEKENSLEEVIFNELGKEDLDPNLLTKEINFVKQFGVQIKNNTTLNKDLIASVLTKEFDGIVLTVEGFDDFEVLDSFLLHPGDSLIVNTKPVFKVGKAAKQTKLMIREAAQTKQAIFALDAILNTEIIPTSLSFNSTVGKIEEHEKSAWLKESKSNAIRFSMPITLEEVASEASNCMHCDCRAQDNCQLRTLSAEYKVNNPKYKFQSQSIVKKINEGSGLIFENAKCIKCGLCVRLLEKIAERNGIGFQGRGFKSIISEPLTHTFNEVLNEHVDLLVDICPTGALSKKEIDS
ncbi:MAG: (2Fe-2S)-binding protein [Bacteroidales bacterium]|nr:(2Fe-2S)-binding protein [Bacteroidales bacterium]